MGDSFTFLNARDLFWSRMVRDYLLGTRAAPTDLTMWSKDVTRMPYRMHTEYLRSLYLDNALAHGTYRVGDRPVALSDIHVPIFLVGTVKDHISPWRSVYKLHLLADTEITFVLTSGGHNAGIVSEPGHAGRSYQMALSEPNGRYVDPDHWLADAASHEGSWWNAWDGWLARRSGRRVGARAVEIVGRSEVLGDAPGTYVIA
jgi:polyhydroxyalkanoate synthase